MFNLQPPRHISTLPDSAVRFGRASRRLHPNQQTCDSLEGWGSLRRHHSSLTSKPPSGQRSFRRHRIFIDAIDGLAAKAGFLGDLRYRC
jgi:hypothetical protein